MTLRWKSTISVFGALAILILNHILSVSHSTSKFSIINSYLIRKLSQAGNKATGIGGVLGKGQKECVALMHEKTNKISFLNVSTVVVF